MKSKYNKKRKECQRDFYRCSILLTSVKKPPMSRNKILENKQIWLLGKELKTLKKNNRASWSLKLQKKNFFNQTLQKTFLKFMD